MKNKEDIKKTISNIKEIIKKTYHVRKLALFGSYVRGENKESSDIDILVDFDITPDLLTFLELEEFLSKKLGKTVDLIPMRKIKNSLKTQILDEAMAL